MTNKFFKSFCDLVLVSLYERPGTFATPPVPVDEYKDVLKGYNLAVGKYEIAPKVEKTNMLIAKAKMTDVLDQLAVYVNGIANGNADIIILAGFEPTKGVREKSKPLEQFSDFNIVRSTNLGEVNASIDKFPLQKDVNYMMICTTLSVLPEDLLVDGNINTDLLPEGSQIALNNGRVKVFKGLKQQTTHYFYLFLSNTVSISPFSVPKSINL